MTAAACGTVAGYSAHYHRNEPPCQACREAHAVDNAARRARQVEAELQRPSKVAESVRRELLATLASQNRDLARLSGRVIVHVESARAFTEAQLRDAVAVTGAELVRLIRITGEQ
jgi:hypothetical protein